MKNLICFGIVLAGLTALSGQEDRPAEADVADFEKKVEAQIEGRLVAEAKARQANQIPNRGLLILCEFIEVQGEAFADWVFQNPLSSDAGELRKAVEEWIETEQGTAIERLVVTSQSGQRAKVEAVTEQIYPTEFDPVEITAAEGGVIQSPPNPTAFETRNVGATLEVDAVVGEGGEINLNLAPEVVQFVGYEDLETSVGEKSLKQPIARFHAAKTTTQVNLRSGQYGLVGVSKLAISSFPEDENAVLLIFVRVDASGY
ncbi:MAG: hypothetical protein AAF236_04610 [Verrucomicrobiota bacterium]